MPNEVLTEAISPEPAETHAHAEDLRGAARLVVTATQAVTGIVEDMHRTIASGPAILGKPLAGPARLLTGVVYPPIRGVTAMVGGLVDTTLRAIAPHLAKNAPSAQRDAIVSALNGVVGDHLEETDNPLALSMTFRVDGRDLPTEPVALAQALPHATAKLLVLVHGCAMNDRQWLRNGHDHGEALARDLGFTPVYVRYNSGRHISTNGRELAHKLEALTRAWPVPLDEITLLGHSMGGLVARSATHIAEAEGLEWRRPLRRLVCLGAPHHGSPLERGGNVIDLLLGVSAYSAPLAKLGMLRSAGVTDLRHGNVIDEHWQGRGRFERECGDRACVRLPEGVDCFAIGATATDGIGAALLGDGLVPLASALGRHDNPLLTLAFPDANQWIAERTGHLQLLESPAVYAKLRGWLAAPHRGSVLPARDTC
jgi:pimeloyl-ACP methyl ester carboxylesterase